MTWSDMQEQEFAELTAKLRALLDFEYLPNGDGYNRSAEAVKDGTVAVFNFLARYSGGGITGFQGSWAALSAYAEVMGIKGPLRVIQADDAVYPQYDLVGSLIEWLSSEEMREHFVAKATELLGDEQDRPFVNPRVEQYWQQTLANKGLIPRLVPGWAEA